MKFLLTFYSLYFCHVSSQNLLKLSGLRNGVPLIAKVSPNQKFEFRVFGKNLPDDGYFFTTATRCQDHNLTDNSAVSTVFVKTIATYCSSAHLSVPNGLPFNVSNTAYHLCHLNGTAQSDEFLQVHKEVVERVYNYSEKIILCILCVMLSAYSSGMTLGYMKFSIVELNRMISCGEPNVAARARRILRFRRLSNWLVISFSLFSSIFTVLFTMTVESMLDGVHNEDVLKIVVPTLVLFIFAEMLPQAICNSKFGFNLASGFWFVTVIIFIVTGPIAYPASLVLGRYLKRNVREVLTHEEKTCMIRNLAKNANEREKTILENATTFSHKKVEDLMVPIEQVFLLSRSQKLNRSTILTLVEKGYTRVPICDEKNKDAIVGMMNMKDLNLITCDLSKEPTVREVLKRIEKRKQKKGFAAKYVNSEMNAQLLLDQMRTGDFHFSCVVKYKPYTSKVIGIITIEDILEELFGKIDEINEKRVRSSVDDRADNAVIGWCREAGTDKKYPLLFSQQLRVLQCVLKECYVFRALEMGIFKVKQLLAVDRIKTAQKGETLAVSNVFVVIWRGTVSVTNAKETFEQEVNVPPRRCSREDTLEHQLSGECVSDRSSDRTTAGRPRVPALILGKLMLNKLVISLDCPFREPIREEDHVEMCVAVSNEVNYFELRMEDLLNTINGGMVPKNEHRPTDSLMNRLSRSNTPVRNNSPTRSSMQSVIEPEKVPLLSNSPRIDQK